MTTTDHLKLSRILAKCRENLALAEKRTSGQWVYITDNQWDVHGRRILRIDGTPQVFSDFDADLAFIAACAGSAESGWRSTIAVIEAMGDYRSDSEMRSYYAPIAAAILAAWPEELL